MSLFPIDAISRCRVLVVGDVMLDRYWFGEVDRISPEAPVPVVRVVRREDRLGGAANVARNIVALGAQATLLGVVGGDEAGASVRNLVQDAAIRCALVTDPAQTTTLKMRVLGRQQQLLRVDFEHPSTPFALDGVDAAVAELVTQHDVVIFSDYAKGVLDRVQSLIAIAKANNVPVLVDPKGDDYSRYHGVALITPNRSEMHQAVGRWNTEDELTDMAQRLRKELAIEALLVTRSEQGMTLFTDAQREHTDAQAHEVFDVSGAGDTVLATLAVCRAAGLSWGQAMYWANQAGGIVVGKLGTSIVSAAELLGETS